MLSKLGLLLSGCLGYRIAFRRDSKVFPYAVFPEPPIIDNGDNHGLILQEIIIPSQPASIVIVCINVWLGNGACNRENNKPECNYDGGDCCRNTCIQNCLLKSKTIEPCQFKCGTFNGYECLEQNAGCAQCSYHGTCLSQERCIKPIVEKVTLLQEISRLLYNCKAMDWTMGNLRTINLYCGTDPIYDVVHDENFKKLHFPGCGLLQDQCTLRPCCTDALRYDFNSETCTNEVLSYVLYDPLVKTTKLMETSCIEFFYGCFFDNYKYYGQCCQCFEGWTGIDCMTPVCYPNCVNGTCIHPNLCLCNTGWQGAICNLGKCTKCIYGICTGPDQCDCFYGYKGFSCDIPISYPPCLHGVTTQPNVCKCDAGWQSRICDVPICDPDCGPQGHCIAPNICECNQGWFSSSVTSICDTLDVHMLDPNCITSTNDFCIECDFQYYLDPSTHKCNKCNEYYDAMCIECSHVQCLECQWPYNVDPKTKTCVSFGVFEFINTHLDVSENEDVVQVYVRRLYGFNTTVTVDYDMRMEDKSYSRIEYRHDTIVFMDQDRELPIDLKVYKRPYFETDDRLTLFNVYLKHPYGGAEIGFTDTITIRYFDDESLNDAQFSYPLLNGIRPSQQFDPDLKNPGGKIETVLKLDTGAKFSIKAHSHYTLAEKKTDGKCVFYMIQRDIRRTQLRDVTRSFYENDNIHSLDFTIMDLQLKFLHVYSSTQGYSFNYFTNTEFKPPAYISRIEKHLPQVVSQAEIKQFNHASLNITFVAHFETANPQEEISFFLQVAEHSEVRLFVNGVEKVYTGLVDCKFKFVDSGARRSYDKLQSTRSFPVEVESCCVQKFSFKHLVNRQTPYYFEINYVQWNLPRNGPCIRLDRSSTSLPLDSIDREAQAITELTDSPFIVQPILNVPFLDVTKSKFQLIPHLNVNTGADVASNQFQCCVVNKYLITHRYDDLQIYELADLVLTLKLQTPKGAKSATSYFDQALKKHFVELYYCDVLQTDSTLSLTLNGSTHVSNSPMAVKMIPGPYDFPSSVFKEDNPVGCYLHFEKCYARLDLKDKGANLVMQPGILSAQDADFVLTGPLSKPTKESIWFQTILEAKVSPFYVQIVINPKRSGIFELYARFNGKALPTYPLTFQIYSTIPSPPQTLIGDPKSIAHQICGKDLVFQITVRDKARDPLTATSVFIKSRLESTTALIPPIPAKNIIEVSTAVYQVTIVATVKGNYNLVIEVQKEPNSTIYEAISGSPYSVYWESAESFNTLTTVDGTGTKQVYSAGIETLNLHVRDQFGNLFNFTYWEASYAQHPLYLVQLLGDGTSLEIYETGQNPQVGLFMFMFVSKLYYNSLVLSVQIYTYQAGVWSYKHIPGSPFPLTIIEQNYDFYCKQIDLLFVGYGLTQNTEIQSLPSQVVAGVSFETKIDPRNVFKTVQIASHDPLSDLYLLDFVPEQAQCICNPSTSKYCQNFSGSYAECAANKQCKWTYIPGKDAGGSLTNCVPCDNSEECRASRFGFLTSNIPVQTNDSVNYYLRSQINKKGTFKAQLNVWTQSGLKMLVFQKPDFQALVMQQRAYNFTHIEFNSLLSEVFQTNADWSVAFLGKIKYSAMCDPLIPNRATQPKFGTGITVTYTISTNLEFEAYVDNKLVAWHQAKQQTVNARDSVRSFTISLTTNQFFDFGLYLQFDSVHKEQRIDQGAKFLELYVETFNTERRVILPNEMFMLTTVSNTLIPTIQVIPSAANAQRSNVVIQSGNWAVNCEGTQIKRAPFVLTDVHIQIRDDFGNQKLLGTGESLILAAYRGKQISRLEELGDWTHMTAYRSEIVNQALSTLDYVHSTQLTESFYVYELKFELNGSSLPQTCKISLVNGSIDVSKSNAELVQQDKYYGHDLCIFASELAYLVFELKDTNGNAIPLDDGAAFHDLFDFQFQFGSEFTSQDCQQYGPIGQLERNTIICRIRPAKAGSQQLSGYDKKLTAFNGFPKLVQVLPSVHKRLVPGDIRIQRLTQSVIVSFTPVDAHANLISTLAPPCDYFCHERLIYTVRVIDVKGQTQTSTQAISFNSVLPELSFQVSYSVKDAYLELLVLDGILLENGISLKFYTEDNFLLIGQSHPRHLDQTRRPLFVEILQDSLVASASKYWATMHQKYDRFSLRAATIVKPKFSEVYFFLSSIQSGKSSGRITGFELWVGETLVIGEGKNQGAIQLQKDLWYAITVHYRVSNNTDPLAPQLLIQWQSASQQVTTINAASGQAVALDIWEVMQVKRAAVFNDIIAL